MTRPSSRRPTRSGSKIEPRASSAIPVEDDQLIETSELAARPPLRLAIHETSAAHADAAAAVAASFGHQVVARGVGKGGGNDVLAEITGKTPPDLVLIAYPGGEAVLEAALALTPRPVLALAAAGSSTTIASQAAALGVELFATKPYTDERLGPVLAAGAQLAAERQLLAQARGTVTLLRARLEKLGRADGATGFQHFQFFQRVLELELKRARRYGYPLSVCLLRTGSATQATAEVSATLRQKVGQAVASSVRDIDLLTEVADDRILVLLPYTDAAGALRVGKRIVDAVAGHEPVRAAGKSWRSTVTAGLASIKPGEAISFAKLMRDARLALEKAERQGSNLVAL